MPANYFTNGEISRPLQDSRLQADVRMGGLAFSYQWGMFWESLGQSPVIKLPPPWSATPGGSA